MIKFINYSLICYAKVVKIVEYTIQICPKTYNIFKNLEQTRRKKKNNNNYTNLKNKKKELGKPNSFTILL